MKGARWKAIVEKNQKMLEDYVAKQELDSTIAFVQDEIQYQVSYVQEYHFHDVHIKPRGTFHNFFRIGRSKKQRDAADIDVGLGGRVWYVEDTGSGAEEYSLIHLQHEKKKWIHKAHVGPFVAVLGSHCYAIEATKPLWFNRLFRVSKHTGKDYEVLLELEDPQWNLTLIKAQQKSLFVLGNNAGQQKLWGIQETGSLKELTGAFSSFIPVGFSSGEFCFFARKPGSQSFLPIGAKLKSYSFPSLHSYIPQQFSFDTGTLVARRFGKRSLWNCKSSYAKLLDEYIGDIELDPYSFWDTGKTNYFLIRPGFERVPLDQKNLLCSYARSLYKTTRSTDGTLVPYILVSSCSPQALLCVGYGAYGLPTHLDTGRWKPLLKRGWGICICLIRGGGDHNDEWAESARRDQKLKSIEDFESCIRAAQKAFNIPASKTAIYGRSAGGYLVGSALARNAGGHFFGAVYAEVPYVDVLSTTANPKLPLTKLEYEEFGNPMERIPNAQALISLSPVHALPEGGAPNVFVLSRTAINDTEVFAYESVKWITKLQDLQEKHPHPQPKLLAIENGEGHFSVGPSSIRQKATDLALLLNWASADKKSNPQIYDRMYTRKNRKNNASRKNRKNNNATLGGKRKRRSTTRKSRKGRKGSRK